MKLIALVIKQYDKLFKEQIFNFSDEYKVDFNFETNELKIDKNPDYIENFYGESIYNISPIVGINGTGKSTLLELIKYVTQNSDSHLNNNNSYFKVFKDNEKFKVKQYNMTVRENENFEINGDDEQFQEPNVNTAINYYNLHNQSFWGVTGVPENSNILEMEINWSSLANYFRIYSEFYDKEIFSDFKFKILLTKSSSYPESSTKELNNKKEFIKDVCLRLISFFIEKRQDILGDLKEKIDKALKDIAHFKYRNDDDCESDITFYLEKMRYLDNELASLMNSLKVENQKVSFFEVFQKISDFLFLLNNYIMSIENEKILIKFSRDLSQDQEFLDICKKFDSLRSFLNQYSYLGFNILEFDSFCMSAGETNFIRLFSNALTSQQFNEDIRDYIFLIDEIEMGMHLEWSRKLINNFVEFLKRERRREDVNLQLIFTTHSPYMLSDIKPGNVIMLEKNQETGYSEGKVLQNTFAKNIQEIMKENLIDNIYGDFALAKINSMISRLNGEVAQAGDEEEGLLKEIHLISEPILRNKLLEMYDKKYKTEESSIDKQLNQLNLNVQQRMQVKKMIEENNKK
ncbi:AAA family ATPase [Streptococcus intermedius]|uniref:AAA family ATPase n=1 Tax=Streptococcus intermedius TaxID=1338 RepID=UPI0006617296|nr:AAA family ATPase [Streptococcus intermedius]